MYFYKIVKKKKMIILMDHLRVGAKNGNRYAYYCFLF